MPSEEKTWPTLSFYTDYQEKMHMYVRTLLTSQTITIITLSTLPGSDYFERGIYMISKYCDGVEKHRKHWKTLSVETIKMAVFCYSQSRPGILMFSGSSNLKWTTLNTRVHTLHENVSLISSRGATYDLLLYLLCMRLHTNRSSAGLIHSATELCFHLDINTFQISLSHI